MRQYKQNNHLILKVLAIAIVGFLVVVALKDWTPTQTAEEKTVVYNAQ